MLAIMIGQQFRGFLLSCNCFNSNFGLRCANSNQCEIGWPEFPIRSFYALVVRWCRHIHFAAYFRVVSHTAFAHSAQLNPTPVVEKLEDSLALSFGSYFNFP